MYKNKKYNAVLMLLVFIISIVVGVSTGISSVMGSPDIEVEKPDKDAGFDNNSPLPDGLTRPGEGANAFERVDFALKILDVGQGFTSNSLMAITALNHTQNVHAKRYRSQTENIVEEWYKMDGVLSSLGENKFITRYDDQKNIKSVNIFNKEDYDYANKTYNANTARAEKDIQTVHQWEVIKGYIGINDFFTTVNSSTSSVLSYDNKGREKTYYTVKLSIMPSKLNSKFSSMIEKVGVKDYEISSIVIALRIDKATGYLIDYEVNGTIRGTKAGFTAQAQIYLKEVYSTMNKTAKTQIDALYQQNFSWS